MKSRKKKILNMYFVQKLKPVDIAKKLNIAKSSVTRVLQKDRRYMKFKQERKVKNRQKHIKETKDYIKAKRMINQFKNNADDLILKNMHNQASVELSKPKKLSNMAYRNWNKSAYSYNEEKRRFEFREELGRSHDVPKYIKVEVL
jgi:hypothetical protein